MFVAASRVARNGRRDMNGCVSRETVGLWRGIVVELGSPRCQAAPAACGARRPLAGKRGALGGWRVATAVAVAGAPSLVVAHAAASSRPLEEARAIHAIGVVEAEGADERRFGQHMACCPAGSESDVGPWVAIASPMLADDAARPGVVELHRVVRVDGAPRVAALRLEQRLVSSQAFDGFGSSIALGRFTGASPVLAVGCPERAINADGVPNCGAVATFRRGDDGAWRPWGDAAPAIPQPGADFGRSVAFLGATLLVGAPRADAGVADAAALGGPRFDVGSLHVFLQQPVVATHAQDASWREVESIEAPHAQSGARFGSTIACEGSVVAVASPDFDVIGPDGQVLSQAGRVDLFTVHEADRGRLRHVAALCDPKPTRWARFGQALAIEGHTLLVGAPGGEVDGVRCGVVQAFDLRRVEADEVRHLVRVPPPADARGAGCGFGSSLAIDGTTILAGAPGHDLWRTPNGALQPCDDCGAVWLIDLGSGAALAELPPPRPVASGYFGWSLARVGEGVAVLVLAGQLFVEEESTAPNAGVAVFTP